MILERFSLIAGLACLMPTGSAAQSASHPLGQKPLSVSDYGAAGNGQVFQDGFIQAGSTTLNSMTATFSGPADVGKIIVVTGAGPGTPARPLVTTITAVTGSHSISLANGAAATVSKTVFTYGTDDTAAIVSTFAAAARAPYAQSGLAGGGNAPYVFFPGGNYFTHTLNVPFGISVIGDNQFSVTLTSISAEPLMQIGEAETISYNINTFGELRGLTLNCAGVGTRGLVVGFSVERSYRNIFINWCTDTNLLLDGKAQNNVFESMSLTGVNFFTDPALNISTYGLRITNGAGGNTFNRIEVQGGSQAGVYFGWDAALQRSEKSPIGYPYAPNFNYIYGSIVENSVGSKHALQIEHGSNNHFIGGSLNQNRPGTPAMESLIYMGSDTGVNRIERTQFYTPDFDHTILINDGYANSLAEAVFSLSPLATKCSIDSGSVTVTDAPFIAPDSQRIFCTHRVAASVPVLNGGAGYVSPPAVTFSGGECVREPVAVAVLPEPFVPGPRPHGTGTISQIWMVEGGYGCTGTPSVSLSGGNSTTSAKLGSVVMKTPDATYNPLRHYRTAGNSGSRPNYGQTTSAPYFDTQINLPIFYSGSAWVDANANVVPTTPYATAVMNGHSLAAITYNLQGQGYSSPPTISFAGGGCTVSPAAVATVSNGIVTGIEITKGGNCTSAPRISFAPPSPSYSCRVYSGSGNPNGVITGNPCDTYLNKSGGVRTTLWVKEDGAGTNTGWAGK